MSAYLGNVNTMSKNELEEALASLAENWRKSPHLSNDHSEGVRYSEITDALRERFKINKSIKAISNPTDYQVV